MSNQLKDRLFDKACRIFACDSTDNALHEILETAGKELGLSGVMYLHTGEIPMLFDIRELWELTDDIGEKRPILDCSENAGAVLVDPFREEKKCAFIDDIGAISEVTETIEFMKHLNMTAVMVTTLMKDFDYPGFIIYYDTRGARAWSAEEKSAVTELAKVIYPVVIRKKKAETLAAIASEANRMAQRAEAQRGRFLSNISREMRTPINAITGMISIMRHNMENPEVMGQCLGRMDKSSKQLMELINDCVDMTLIDHEEMKLNNEWIAPSDLIDNVTDMIGPVAEERSQKLLTECSETVQFFGDRIKLLRVLLTLLTHSCRYAQENGTIRLDIRYVDMGKNKKAVQISVIDDGVGMDDEVKKNVFNPLAGSEADSMNTGTGLSLMLMKQLVDMMHGTVDLASTKGEGTTIVIVIPCELRNSVSGGAAASDASENTDDAELYMGRRILVAEDNTLMAEIFATIMGYRGLDVDIAMNGEEAVNMYTSHGPFYYDMIFMDIQMPVMDGIEATGKIRQSGRADAAILPIVALSANTFEEDEKRSLDAGMNAHLGKPVSDRELFETIGKFLL